MTLLKKIKFLQRIGNDFFLLSRGFRGLPLGGGVADKEQSEATFLGARGGRRPLLEKILNIFIDI